MVLYPSCFVDPLRLCHEYYRLLAIPLGWFASHELPLGLFFAAVIPLMQRKLPATIIGHGKMVGTPPVPDDLLPQPRPAHELFLALPGNNNSMPQNGLGMCCRSSAYDALPVAQAMGIFILKGCGKIMGGWLVWKVRDADRRPRGWMIPSSILLVMYDFLPRPSRPIRSVASMPCPAASLSSCPFWPAGISTAINRISEMSWAVAYPGKRMVAGTEPARHGLRTPKHGHQATAGSYSSPSSSSITKRPALTVADRWRLVILSSLPVTQLRVESLHFATGSSILWSRLTPSGILMGVCGRFVW
jgi:hypothetical protein